MNKFKIILIILLVTFIPISSLVFAIIKTPNLVGGWRFEGDAYDWSGNGKNGTVTGATLTTAGKFGRAYSFDGNDYVSVPQLLSGNGVFTAEAWVRPGDITTAWKTVFAEGCNGFDLNINSATIYFGRNCGAGNGFYSGPTVSANVWYHLAIVFDGTNLNLYKDGVKYTGGPSVYSHAPLYIGSYNGLSEMFIGLIDEIRIYNRVLTESEIRQDMLGYSPKEF